MSTEDEQGLKECEAYVQEHKIQQTLKECIVQVSINVLLELFSRPVAITCTLNVYANI